jgi:uncharacterized protein (TIGR03790 family)
MDPTNQRGTHCWAILALLLASSPVCASSGRAFNTLVVVNTNSLNSIELGDYYAAAHGIPAHQICPLDIATNLTSITSNEFHDLILTPVTNHIAAEGLDGQIDFLVLSWDFPTRIRDVEGVTASLFYGFKNAPGHYDPPADVCKLAAGTSNAFYRAERAFRSSDGWNAINGFIAFHLVASNLATAKLVVDRGAAAQASRPAGSIYLNSLGEFNRYERERHYAGTQFAFLSLPGLPASCSIAILRATLSGKTNVIGHHDGYGSITANARTNNLWLPGAYADHMTSWGGRIQGFTNNTTQSTVLDWMGIGATASYGTIAEPCNYVQKFPAPLMAFWHARGFTLGESYAMAVEAPYQGLFAGDPLAAPYAAPPVVSVSSHAPYAIVTGTVPFQISAEAHAQGAPPASCDLYLNGRFHSNLATLGPTENNQLAIAVAGVTSSVSVAASQTLFDAVAALADEINDDTNQIVSASAFGDRIELIYKLFDHAGDNTAVAASVSAGGSEPLTVGIGLAATNMVPSIYPARKRLWLYTHTDAGANTGDTVQCILTLTNGVAVTNLLVAAQGEKITNLLERLRLAINTNSTLMATNGAYYERIANGVPNVRNDGTLFARTPGPDGAGILVDFSVNAVSNNSGLMTNFNFTSFMLDSPDDLRPRASVLFHVTSTNGNLDAEALIDTTLLDDGLHMLDFVARDGSAVAAASRFTLPVYVCNESPLLTVAGTNGAAVINNEPPSAAKGTDFGIVAWNQPLTNILAIHNNGSVPLSIASWTTNGSGATAFEISNVPSVVEAGGQSNFWVVFTASTSDLYEASLSFDSDALVPQTNILFSGTGAMRFTLNIESEHGTPAPPVGIHTNWQNAVLTNSVNPPVEAGGTQLVSAGWSMTGNEPLSGSATNMVMSQTNDATLTWLWSTNFWLDTAAGPNGSVNVGDSWHPAGSSTQITATADLYYHFVEWTGDVSSTNNPLELLMDSPKSIQADFAAALATNSVPHWWLASHGWTNDFDDAALDDPDEDGYLTWQEYIADTDPTNSASFFPPLEATGSATNLAFGIDPTSTGRFYHVDVTAPLDDPDWTSVTNAPGTGGAWVPELAPPGTGFYFYRGRVTLPP